MMLQQELAAHKVDPETAARQLRTLEQELDSLRQNSK
jgi:hypothetical protein